MVIATVEFVLYIGQKVRAMKYTIAVSAIFLLVFAGCATPLTPRESGTGSPLLCDFIVEECAIPLTPRESGTLTGAEIGAATGAILGGIAGAAWPTIMTVNTTNRHDSSVCPEWR
ncbi:hypothetical protein CLG94_09490 [Candidatus Methylomirabilis limnetica]|uniref:Glycine zipper domain-containing protein n=2 Tax=Candidatus Methylomirabilis limnetica TaxID=2033718 RepID=A0A2T4TWJ8_9BACT|nr:hypothetical protein CLG94_09490 [Candidatus Methylomirabilis limnetica]